jgi:hypothetical protein
MFPYHLVPTFMDKQDERLWEHRENAALSPKKTETRTIQRKKKQREPKKRKWWELKKP